MSNDHDGKDNSRLNPELKQRTDMTHETERTAAPLETTNAHEGAQGEGWPWVWLLVTLVSVVLAIYFLL